MPLDFGTPASAMRGRNPRFPFVPIIRYVDRGPVKTRQVTGMAFATEAEAVAHAEKSGIR